jgi:imidazolonepropionase-like amidohydrolase
MRTLFRGGRIFDGSGADAASGDVVIEGDSIVDVGVGLDGDVAVDCTGKTVLPGLFDCHVHVMFSGNLDYVTQLTQPFSYQFYEAMVNLRRTLQIGITTVRDAGGADLGVRQAVEDGLIAGPRMKIAISLLSQTGGHGDGWMACGLDLSGPAHPGMPAWVVDGPHEVRSRVRQVLRAGADQIKVAASGGVLSPRSDPKRAQFQPDEIREMVAEAAAAGTYVMAHAQSADGIKNALRAGARSIEHGVFLDDQALELMLQRDAWLVPTLVAPAGVLEAAARGDRMPDQIVRKSQQLLEAHRASFRRAVAAGVRIAMGTDSGVTPHGRNLRELGLMAEAGMAPAAVLHATTLSAARLMQLDERLGSLEKGKLADLVVIDGDAFDFTELQTRVSQVWKVGVRVHPSGQATDQSDDAIGLPGK